MPLGIKSQSEKRNGKINALNFEIRFFLFLNTFDKYKRFIYDYGKFYEKEV